MVGLQAAPNSYLAAVLYHNLLQVLSERNRQHKMDMVRGRYPAAAVLYSLDLAVVSTAAAGVHLRALYREHSTFLLGSQPQALQQHNHGDCCSSRLVC